MEEAEEVEEIPDRSAEKLVTVLHSVHCNNSELQYYAKLPNGGEVSIMPLTPFVYEFFLFNSLYQVDWDASNNDDGLVFHPENDFGEVKKQKAFLSFIKSYANKNPADLYRAFEPLLHIGRAEGEWTRVTPDSRISILKGERFFRDVLKLQDLLEHCENPSDIPTNTRMFEILRECTYFIYLVRNNIFHGSKTLREGYERNQKRRIEVYDLFLKGLTSLFFLASGKDKAACDFVPCPIFSSSLPNVNNGKVFDQSSIIRAIAKRFMKAGDSRLVARFTKIIPPPAVGACPTPKASLYYPSAGTDLLTPILLGLPYCTQFYFFERSHRNEHQPQIANILREIEGVQISKTTPQWKLNNDRYLLDFEFNGISRRLHWVHADNTAILQEDAELKFYFHRGDSWGEGGSGQEWDSKLLPQLLKLIPASSSCLYLTDGVPGGFETQYSFEAFELNLPFIEKGKTYYCGRFSSTAANAQQTIPPDAAR
ncbi:hypothetical protein PS934_01469 [Pseudomonas fluorescens]|uniref:hypothetical protein n=1 Tax=Pseudomonas fluorescens TaxID=294 RepID=UPI0012419CC0|nr:hypothetical protein [Pseudomonas fluorescens]VVP89366.1 hypothetical protein PS934_01469 [Pseudomonas fluorescens]